SSGIAALAGILIGFQNPNVQFTNFDVFGSINAVLYAVVGGVGWAAGALIGALLAPGTVLSTAVDDIFSGVSNLPSWLLVVSGVAVAAGDGSVMAGRRAVRGDDRPREPPGRSRPSAGRALLLRPGTARALHAQRGAERDRQGVRARGAPQRAAVQALARHCETGRNCARDRHRAIGAAAGRAGRRARCA